MGSDRASSTFLDRVVRFCIEEKLVVALLALLLVAWGVLVAPFDWPLEALPRDPVPVDAIPDIGENQQIVFTEWMGRSPQDVEDQITYPLTVSLLGVPGVKTVRSYSFFGFSSVYVVFEEDVEFFWSRSRILEKLMSLPSATLPEGVQPMLGPDATALGQVFWYTLEGRDEEGRPAGGWDLPELRTIQDFDVRYALLAADGIAEVASIGGFVDEYQIDVDPDAMRAHGVGLDDIYSAVRASNIDVGARTIEINRAEYVIRGIGFVRSVEDLERVVVKVADDVPITVRNIGHVTRGPALRRGALDKAGAEAVGGVVVARHGANPLEAIQAVKAKIAEIAPGLPRKPLPDGRTSRVTIVPFYDRTGLIRETLGTLESALRDEILVTILVVLVMVFHLRSSLLISSILPLGVLGAFVLMKLQGVDANIVALSGIAIAIGTMVDMGIVVCENVLKHLSEAKPDEDRKGVVFRAVGEVGGAVLTSVLTTIVGFLPVFAMSGAEGKLFKPLAWTKTFALLASIVLALTVLPPLAHAVLARRARRPFLPERIRTLGVRFSSLVVALLVAIVLSGTWAPLGPGRAVQNLVFVVLVLGGLLLLFRLFLSVYEPVLRWCLANKLLFLAIPSSLVVFGLVVWLGFGRAFGFVPGALRLAGIDEKALVASRPWSAAVHAFPGLGKEFMPSLDEGSFLFMPTTMPHASIGEAMDVLGLQDMAIQGIPEVESVVGKIGRAESPLDPAPISMIETVIAYKPEFAPGDDGRLVRQWRDEIRTEDDIWAEIVRVAAIPGTTSAPRLQPIAARIVMLQSGMRAPMGVKVKGPDLETIEAVGLEIERLLKEVPSVQASAVIADRIVGKPYVEIEIDRDAIARYGVRIREVQDVIEVAVGGRRLTTTVEGRERYPVRARYARELRDSLESLPGILVPTAAGRQIPLGQLSRIRYTPGPQVIKSEDTFLVGYVLFDKAPGRTEVDVVEECQRFLASRLESGEFVLPAGVSYSFAGSYENQVRSERTMRVVLPLALFLIFLILYLQFRSVTLTFLVFTGVFVAWAGGFLMIWLYGQSWFANVTLFGVGMRDLFQMGPVSLSVAVWVGFLALFGIATDDGVVMGTYLKQSFAARNPTTPEEAREATVRAGVRRARPCLMTTATTILALLPVLTSRGRGSDVMVPMAIPSFGGMLVEILTMFVVPVLFCAVKERALRREG